MLFSLGLWLWCFFAFLWMATKELSRWNQPARFRFSSRVLLASTVVIGLTGLSLILLTIRDLSLDNVTSMAGTLEAILKIGTVLVALAWVTAMTHRSRLAENDEHGKTDL